MKYFFEFFFILDYKNIGGKYYGGFNAINKHICQKATNRNILKDFYTTLKMTK